MSSLLIYTMKVAFYLAAFYLVYSIFLKRDKAYSRNRIFILTTVISSALLPLLTFNFKHTFDIQVFGELLSDVTITEGNRGNGEAPVSTFSQVHLIYIGVLVIFIFRFCINISSLIFLILRNRKPGSRVIYINRFNAPAFSAMGYIFIKSGLPAEDTTEIIRHEKNHLREYHYLDIIFIEIIVAIQWFNPFIYLIRKELRAVHEYQADHDCLCSGIALRSYQNLLLCQVFKSKSVLLSNSFSSPSLLRRRMIMMSREPSSRFAGMKMLSVIPVAGIVFMMFSAKPLPSLQPLPVSLTETVKKTMETQPDDRMPYVVVDEMPRFTGGDAALLKYIGEEVIYPESAKRNMKQGRVIVRFCVTSAGSISKISVLKGVDPDLDNEAIRVVSTLPSFIPGKQGGKPVPVWYMVPITFTLK